MNVSVRVRMAALLGALTVVAWGTILSSRLPGGGDQHFAAKPAARGPVVTVNKGEPMVSMRIPEGKTALDFGFVKTISRPSTDTETAEMEDYEAASLSCSISFVPKVRGEFPK